MKDREQIKLKLPPELEVYRDAIATTIEPYIKIKLTNNNSPDIWQSKLGGVPYFPKDFDYPKSYDGEYLYLLAQINFAEVPQLESFPKEGILQFYVAADEELYGMDLNHPSKQDKFRVLYFPKVDSDVNNLITNFDFLPHLKAEDWLMPFQGCCSLEFTQKTAPISICDRQFNIFPRYEVDDRIFDCYYDLFCTDINKIGGYPNFIQNDPRDDYGVDNDSLILLLQLDSQQNEAIQIWWADGGIANFFIKKSALERWDFSEVFYNWDCG